MGKDFISFIKIYPYNNINVTYIPAIIHLKLYKIYMPTKPLFKRSHCDSVFLYKVSNKT